MSATGLSAPRAPEDPPGTPADAFWEGFWAACRRDWRAPLVALGALGGGRAGVLRALGTRAAVDTATLPPLRGGPRDPAALGRAVLQAARPHQWLKNLLVFLPMLAAHRFDAATLGASLLAFVAFSLVASSVYVLNDLLDLAADRAHPRKRGRPFASGRVPLGLATAMLPVLLVAGLAVAATLGATFLGVIAFYWIVTLAYSLLLKRRMVVDICTLAGLYTLRIIAGGVAAGLPPSVWMLAFSIFFFFAIAAVKRQGELIDGAARGELKAWGRGYHVEDVAVVSAMALASGYVSVLVLALYLDSPAVSRLYGRPEALWGICLVLLYWISRLVMVTHRGRMDDDPVVFAVRDPVSRVCLLAIAALALAGAAL
jgi:4-hydroxybenzoate polyprenyltransferase